MSSDTIAGNQVDGTYPDTVELRQQVVGAICVMLLIVSYVGWWHTLLRLRVLWPRFIVFFLLFVGALVSLLSRKRWPSVSSCSLIVSLSVGVALAVWLRHPPWAGYFSAVVVVVGFALSPLLGFVAATGNTILLIMATDFGTAWPVFAVLWSVAVAEALSQRRLYTALHWAWDSQTRSTDLLHELRSRRAELARTLSALTEASRRLERTNRELIVARQAADEARAFKEHFVANVSHELRTPLNLIVGFGEMLYLSPELYDGVRWTPDLVSDLGEIYRASRHLQSLVNDVLDLSRIDVGRLPMFREMAHIRPVIDEVAETVRPLLQQRGLPLRVDCAEGLPQLLIDRTRVRQVLLNLLTNAIRFTARGGITVRIVRDDAGVVVSVADTGPGIPAAQLKRIFERFTQVHAGLGRNEGAGLGLAISQQFVELHGGRMWAESIEGRGSTFFFSLPLPGRGHERGTLQRVPDRERASLSDAPVLVVDPDPNVAEMLARYLDNRRTLSVGNLVDAEAAVSGEHPAAIIVNQSPRVDDAGWVGAIGPASDGYGVPIIRCSLPSTAWLQQAMGIDGCLTKPVTRKSVESMVERYCHDSRPILIVDDDRGFVSLVRRMLSSTPRACDVLVAYSGDQAVRTAIHSRPQLVFLDLLMPHTDGFQVVEKLRADPSLSETRIVAVTATSYAEEELLQRGGYFTLTQPKGIGTGSLLELLALAVEAISPHYADASTRSSV